MDNNAYTEKFFKRSGTLIFFWQKIHPGTIIVAEHLFHFYFLAFLCINLYRILVSFGNYLIFISQLYQRVFGPVYASIFFGF